MRDTRYPHESARRVLSVAMAALAVALLCIPVTVAAQGSDTQAQPTQDQGQRASDAQGPEPRMSRGTARFIRLYDTNNDGKVSIEEINDDQARMFTALDIDNDKQMSVEEIRRRGRSLQIFRTTTLFDLLDTNGDGQLSLAEVQAPSKRWFKRYDENGDGVMEAGEIPQQRSWGRGGRH